MWKLPIFTIIHEYDVFLIFPRILLQLYFKIGWKL